MSETRSGQHEYGPAGNPRIASNFIEAIVVILEQVALVCVQFEMTCWFEPPPRRGLPTLSQWTSQHYFVLRMILSDLPTPAEALVRTTKIMPGLRAGGKPVPIPDQVRDRLFRDHAPTRPRPARPSSPRRRPSCGACRAAGSRRSGAPDAWSGDCPTSQDRIAASGGHRRARAAWRAR